MTSKFFLPAKVVGSALGLLLCLESSTLQAQSTPPVPTASPTPSPTPRKPAGWLRFWNMLPTKRGRLELVSATDPNRVFSNANNFNVTTDYTELAPGNYKVQVFQAGDRQTSFKNLDVSLRDGTYMTVIAHEATTSTDASTPGASPNASPAITTPIVVELVDDTPDPANLENRLTIRQYSPGTRAVVATATKQTTGVLDYGGAQTLTGLPNGITPMVVRASTPVGAATWNTEAEFTNTWRATLLLINDSYGRFRPKTTVDGPPRPTPTPKTKS